ncbi:PPE family protein, SVP subgroup [Mycobacterium simiae]
MYAGPGAGTMLAAAAAWEELANQLHATAADLESVVSGLTGEPWQGPASAAMAVAAQGHVAWLNTTAAQATQTGEQVKAAAAAYESAYAMTVPPPVITANRSELIALVATNLVGQNTAAIAANEVAYAEMWAQDVAAMYTYAGMSRAAAEVRPFAPPEPPVQQDGLSAQGAAIAQATGTAAGQAQTSSRDAMAAVPTALHLLASSPGLADFSDFTNPYDLASLGSGLLGNGVGLIGLSGAAGFISDAEQKAVGPQTVSAPASEASSGQARRMPDRVTTVSADMGRASAVGRVSVPDGWGAAAPQVRLAAHPAAGGGALPPSTSSSGVSGGMPMFGNGPLMALPGRGAAQSRREPGDARQRPAALVPGGRHHDQRERPAGPSRPGVADFHEITDLLGKLGRLRDSGVLTDKEFVEQKQRLLGCQ